MNRKDLEGLKGKLPKEPYFLGRDRYFNSAVLIPLVYLNDEYHFLFEIRAANIPQEGEICFPGGFFDSSIDPDYQSAAVRETVEELGTDKNKISVTGRLGILVSSQGVSVEAYAGTLDIQGAEDLKPNPGEVERIFFLPVSYFYKKPDEYHVRVEVQPFETDENGNICVLMPTEKLGLPVRYRKPWGGRLNRVYLYPTEYGPIWGITAELIYEFIKRIK